MSATRRTVDIAVDAYDAPMLAALAKRLAHIRALGHADGDFVSPPNNAREPSRVGRSGPWRKSMRTHEFVQSNECEPRRRPPETRTEKDRQ